MIKKISCVFLLMVASCSQKGLNELYVQEVKNEISGEIEEHRIVKIFEDDKNEYLLNIKITNEMEQGTTQYGSLMTSYRFSVGEADMYSNEGVLIFKTHQDKVKIDNFIPYYNKVRIFGEADLEEINCDNLKIDGKNFKYCLIKRIGPCCASARPGEIKFSGQKEVSVMRSIQGEGSVWNVEYAVKVRSLGGDNYKDKVMEKFNKAVNYIDECCDIVAVSRNKLGKKNGE